ncbi:MAG: hypothetical protein AAB471_01555 [Patescibacteria group bacterium]
MLVIAVVVVPEESVVWWASAIPESAKNEIVDVVISFLNIFLNFVANSSFDLADNYTFFGFQ